MGKKETIIEIRNQIKSTKRENVRGWIVFFCGVALFIFVPLIGWFFGLILCISGGWGVNSSNKKIDELKIEEAKLK